MIKGTATIEIFDATTGEKISEYINNNIFTNAIKNTYNAPADWQYQNSLSIDTIYELINGVYLFEDELEENVNNTCFPYDAKLIGWANMQAISSSSTDTQRGGITSESAYITDQDGNNIGYKWVWNFPTVASCGNINTVCLYTIGDKQNINIIPYATPNTNGDKISPPSEIINGYTFMGMYEDNKYFYIKISSGNILMRKIKKAYKISMFNDDIWEIEDAEVELTNDISYLEKMKNTKQYIYTFQGKKETSTTSVLLIQKIDPINMTMTETEYEVPVVLYNSTYYTQLDGIINDDVIYVAGKVKNSTTSQFPIYKINIEGTITADAICYVDTSSGCMQDINDNVFHYSGEVYYKATGAKNESYTTYKEGNAITNYLSQYMMRPSQYTTDPVIYATSLDSSYKKNIYIMTKSPKLTTINVLTDTVTKFSTQTMKVTYELIEQN